MIIRAMLRWFGNNPWASLLLLLMVAELFGTIIALLSATAVCS